MKTRKVKTILISLLLAVVAVCGAYIGAPCSSVQAATSLFETTDVIDDLASSTVNGKPFDFTEFENIVKGKPRLLNVVEYCYSLRASSNKNYGLYLYIFNPGALDFDVKHDRNSVSLATAYDEKGAASDYELFQLKFCSQSDGDYGNMFYKFKVVDHDVNGKSMLERVKASERRYDIAGFDLLIKGDQTATPYTVGGTYRFSGYSVGCGADLNDPDTLTCKVEDLETVELKVKYTYYRTDTDDTTRTHHNQLNSVYFSVPNELLKKYGYLQKIKADWYEYKMQPAVVTSNAESYAMLSKYTTTDVGRFNPNVTAAVGYQPYNTGFGTQIRDYYSGFNCRSDSVSQEGYEGDWLLRTDTYATMMPWLFYVKNDVKNYHITSSDLMLYAETYTNGLTGDTELTENNRYSLNLFSDDVDEGHTRGHNVKEFDAGERFNIVATDPDHYTAWEQLKAFFGWASVGTDLIDVEPIHKVTKEDMSAADISEQLKINQDDVADFKKDYAAAEKADQTVFLFRTGVTDYWSSVAEIFKYNVHESFGQTRYNAVRSDSKGESYVSQETMILDFKILTLTFNDDGEYTLIAAVSNPVDIVGSLDAPPTKPDWLKWVLIAFAVVVVLIICAPMLPYVLKGVVWVMMLPFRGVAWIVNTIKDTKKKE